MSHNNDNDGVLYFGGIVVGIILIGLLIKILKSILSELTLVFEAFGKTVLAFIPMALNITLVIGLFALGAFSIYAAWIFSKKYYMLVKDATHVKEQLEVRFANLQDELTTSIEELKRDSVRDVIQMRKDLREALKRSEVTPNQLNVAPAVISPSQLTLDSNTQPANEIAEEKPQIQDAPKDISNPF